jgi:hypothetical protein
MKNVFKWILLNLFDLKLSHLDKLISKAFYRHLPIFFNLFFKVPLRGSI